MAQDEKIPYIDVDEMHEQIVEFYDAYADPDTLFAILAVYKDQAEMLEEVEAKMFEHRDTELFDKWRDDLHEFSGRLNWYVEAVEGADDPYDAYDLISPPLFDGEYSEELEGVPAWADNQTVWKLANELVVIGDERDLSAASLEEMRDHYQTFVEAFWTSVADELTRQMGSDEDIDAEIAKAVEQAQRLASEQPEKVVGMRTRGDNEGGHSIAPFLLAAGALFLMSKRKGRR